MAAIRTRRNRKGEGAVAEPVPMTRASFEAAVNFEAVSSDERRARRAAARSRILPPGFFAPEWVVASDFYYDVGGPRSGERLIVPRGFEFDGASVPLPFTLFVPQTHSLYLAAAALHDYLYSIGPDWLTRKNADRIFRDAMIVCGLNWIWAGLMWRAVRAGGWATWHAERPGTRAHALLALPRIVRVPLVWAITLARMLGGLIFRDLWRLRSYRRDARRIEELDAPRR